MTHSFVSHSLQTLCHFQVKRLITCFSHLLSFIFTSFTFSSLFSHFSLFLHLFLSYVFPNLSRDSHQVSRSSITNASSGGIDPSGGRRGSDSGSIGSNDAPGSGAGGGGFTQQVEQTAQQLKGLIRRASQVTSEDTSGMKTSATDGTTGLTQSEEDTMKNLRKTFAGIFGDM